MNPRRNLTTLIFTAIILFSACQKEVNDPLPMPPTPPVTTNDSAVFTFSGAPGNCLNPIIKGTYEAGKTLDSSNSIILQVNVSKTGPYSISSASVNGIKFSVTDSFATTGAQTVLLKGAGTPVATGSFNYVPPAGCSFTVTFSEAPTANDCKDCIYYPLCVGSLYSYYDTTSGVASVRDADLISSIDTVINTKIFKKITFNTDYGYYYCENGESIAAGYHVVLMNGVNTLEFYKTTILKANGLIGDTWSDSLTSSSGQKARLNYKIEAKGITKKVGTFNFPDLIVVDVATGIVSNSGVFIPATRTKYYFAKGVGLVEATTISASTGQTIYHSVIKSYHIP